MHLPKIGMRNLKTGLGIILVIFLYFLIGKEPPFFACVACVICMQPDVKHSIKKGLERFVGTLIGGALGLCFLLARAGSLHTLLFGLAVGLGVMLAIYLCVLFKIPASAVVTSVVFLSIVINHNTDANAFLFVLIRVVDTTVGIIVAVLVNRFVVPKLPEEEETPDGGEGGTVVKK